MTHPKFSGWITVRFDLLPDDIEKMFHALGDPLLIRIGRLANEIKISLQEFLQGREVVALTTDLNAIAIKKLLDNRLIANPKEPVIILSKDPLGFKVSYPRLFQDESGLIHKTFPEKNFKNTGLFMSLQRYFRNETKAVKKEGHVIRVKEEET